MASIGKYFMKMFIGLMLMNIFISAGAQSPSDTSNTRLIKILDGRSLRNVEMADGKNLLSLAGSARVSQGNTIISGDSMVINQLLNIAEIFGNVHINDADSVHTYAQYLRYLGNERIAYFKRNVRLTDGKGTLLTNDLEYNLGTGIAKYRGGGRVINGKTVLTSANAIYYSDYKEVYFQNYVHLTDPEYDIKADSLRYNTAYRTATFISPTTIVDKKGGGTIRTSNGSYNLATGEAQFFDRTAYADSLRSVIGDNIAYDERSGTLQVRGNGKIVDSSNNVTVFGDEIVMNRSNSSFLATQKPVLVFYKDQDSTYMRADTIFSGLRRYDRVGNHTVIINDTSNTSTMVQFSTGADTIRHFVGYHNVKIFNDSVQAVSDSVFISSEDSVFRMYKNPVVWNGKTQLTGDTIYLFTENQQPKRAYVFNNGMVINEQDRNIYNQLSGRTINAFFTGGEITYARVKGSPAETVFYPLDDDSAYIGLNRLSADAVDAFFAEKELKRLKFIKDARGTLYPIQQVPQDQRMLRNFSWRDAQRPKHYLELFE